MRAVGGKPLDDVPRTTQQTGVRAREVREQNVGPSFVCFLPEYALLGLGYVTKGRMYHRGPPYVLSQLRKLG